MTGYATYRPKNGRCVTWCVVALICTLCTVHATAAGDPAASEFWLITPDEAAVMDQPLTQDMDEHRTRGMDKPETRGGAPFGSGNAIPDTGPIIDVIQPVEGESHDTPVKILINFTPRESPVDIESLEVHILKFIPINITKRVKPFASESGIQIQDANVPSGRYTVRVRIEDYVGEQSVRTISLDVR